MIAAKVHVRIFIASFLHGNTGCVVGYFKQGESQRSAKNGRMQKRDYKYVRIANELCVLTTHQNDHGPNPLRIV
jgi:5-bromo-4-chloroindolyl phosphate hydrolysis protein